jgi:hypothetical protein
MHFLGFARVPRRVGAALASAAKSTADAASELSALSRNGGDFDRLAEAVAESRRSAREATLEAAQMLGGGIDREDVMAIASSLRLMADRTEEAAAALERGMPDAALWEALAGVQRDLAREVAGAVSKLDGTREDTDARLDRVQMLLDEGKQLLRAARSELLVDQDDVAVAVAGQDGILRMERAMLASRASARAVRWVLVKHR